MATNSAQLRYRASLVLWVAIVALIGITIWQHHRHSRLPQYYPLSAAAADSLLTPTLPDSCSWQRLDYGAFTIYHDAALHVPRLGMYILTGDHIDGDQPRPEDFTVDDTVPGCADPGSYVGTGMERGHIVPAGDFKWDAAAILATFMMTNVCPQPQALNQGGWADLETKVREWAERDSLLVVATGPIFYCDTLAPAERTAADTIARLPSGVAIPDAYFKVVLAPCVRPIRAVAFVYPNGPADDRLSCYLTTPARIARLTGIHLFPGLPLRTALAPWLL